MAKKGVEVQETVDSTETKVKKVKAINLVTMEDGSTKNFGERTKLLADHDVSDTSFKVTFHLSNGQQIVYNFEGDTNLLLEMAAFGASSKIKQACTGEKEADGIAAIINTKIKEFQEGNFVTRTTGQITTSLSQIQVAYARVNDIDVTNSDGVAKVNAIFAAMSKEDKSALYTVGKIKLELARLKLEAAEAALELA